jgi:hypothetical protein
MRVCIERSERKHRELSARLAGRGRRELACAGAIIAGDRNPHQLARYYGLPLSLVRRMVREVRA